MKTIQNFHNWFMAIQSRRAASYLMTFRADSILELGCGHGWLSDELRRQGVSVLKSDFNPTNPDTLHVDAHRMPFPDQSFDLILCSNTLEHLHSPGVALKEMRRVGKRLWLTWTPWFSPFGGHEFSPLHYFGKTKGSIHEVEFNLYKTTVAQTLKQLDEAGWSVDLIRPRYWPRLAFLAKWRATREWATWNVEVLCSHKKPTPESGIGQSFGKR